MLRGEIWLYDVDFPLAFDNVAARETSVLTLSHGRAAVASPAIPEADPVLASERARCRLARHVGADLRRAARPTDARGWLLAAGRSRPRLRFHEAESPAPSVDASALHNVTERPVKRYCRSLCACMVLQRALQYHFHGGDRRSSAALGEGAHPARAIYDLLQASLDAA